MRTFLRLAATLLLSLLLALPMPGGTTGIIEGVVRSTKSGETLPGVSVYISSVKRGAVTDANGRFTIQNIRIGTYDLRFTHPGFRARLHRNVQVVADLRTRLQIDLEETDVQLDEIVVVQDRPLIQTDVTATTFVIRSEELRALPISEPFAVLGTKPGTTLEGHVRGGKTSEVSYLVDGLPVQDFMRGGLATVLPISTVVGMTVHTGGFEAEYGNALSGVVNVVTRSAGDELSAFGRANTDHLFGGTQDSRESQAELTFSTPIVRERLSLLAAGSMRLSGTRWWQDFQDSISLPVEKVFSGFGKVEVTVDPTLRFALSILSSGRDWRDYEFAWRYNLDGIPVAARSSHRIALSATRVFGDDLFGTASVSWQTLHSTIGEGSKADLPLDDPYQYDPLLRYVIRGRKTLWMDSRQNVLTLKADGTYKTGTHLFKAGLELNQYSLTSDVVKFEPRMTYFGKPLYYEPQQDFSTAYDYAPRTGSAYVQDKIDVLKEGILLTLGLRYDFLDPRAGRPAIEATLLADSAVFASGQTRMASFKHQFSPRIGMAMGLFEKGFLFFNLGWYFQNPLFEYLYTGLDRAALTRGIPAVVGNPDLEPERSASWEASFRYALPLDVVASVCYFKKESTNLTDTKTFVPGDSKLTSSYGFSEFVNSPYAYVNGWEFVVSRERGEWVTGEVSYTYMETEGITGSAFDGYYIAQYGLPPGRRIAPLSWDQRHTVKAQCTFAREEDFSLTVVGQWHSGRPYTSYPTSTGYETINAGRFALNNARMSPFTLIDLRAEKHIPIPGAERALLTFFIDMRNVFNARNVIWVDSNDRIGGELSDPSGYSIGRRTFLGLQMSF